MTLDELRRYAQTSPTSGRPSYNMTDAQWQEKFKIMRGVTPQSTRAKMGGQYSREGGSWNEDNGSYQGATNWQNYVFYINDILKEIRDGKIEYAYFTYQIADLLRYEHKRLRTRYIQKDQYWEVWLERE